MADRPPIIVKKIRKKHDAHHGGSWKVAYADFVTAMMAFFLLMWLLVMVSPEKRLALSDYFNNFSIWKDTGSSFTQGPGGGPGFNSGTAAREFNPKTRTSAKELRKKIRDAVEGKLKGLENQVIVDSVEGGVRVQLVDNEGSPMFPVGSAEPTEKAISILKLVSENIKDGPNKIAIEGHTDSLPYKKEQITNWELSTSRASAARRELEKNGIDPGRIARVVGYADQELYIKDDPKDPRNRRISIIVLNAAERPFASDTGIKVIPNQIPSVVADQQVQPGTLNGQPVTSAATR